MSAAGDVQVAAIDLASIGGPKFAALPSYRALPPEPLIQARQPSSICTVTGTRGALAA